MQLTYAQLEQTLSAHMQIQPDKLPTFRARIKQLQRLEFPSGINVGRGVRMEYTAEHLFKLATVFELLSFGFPAQAACLLVESHWPNWAAGFALAALNDRVHRNRSEDDSRVFAAVKVNSLHDMQFHKYRSLAPAGVEILDQGWLRLRIEGSGGAADWSHLVIALDRLMKNLLSLATDVAGVKGAGTWSADFHSWLPKGRQPDINFLGYYPDRSNLEMRRHINGFNGEDPGIGSPDDMEEINQFIANNYSPEPGF